MELRHIRYFVAVAEEGHITRAAEKLGIQQPPLSQQIKALEEELGTLLFRRLPRGMALTEAGDTFLTDARQILERVEHARAATQRTARGEQGSIVVGFTSSVPFNPVFPRLIRAYTDATPLVALKLDESGTGELVDGLQNETLDAAFIRSPVGDASGITVHPLINETMVAAVPAGHKIGHSGANDTNHSMALSALSSEPFILYRRSDGPGLYDTIIAGCNAAGFAPNVVQEAPRITSTLNLVAAGLGVTLVPESLRRLRMDGITYRRLSPPAMTAPINLAYRRTESGVAIRRFIEISRRLVSRS